MGGLQWFPKIVGNDSLARELTLTARPFDADEAKQIGFVRYLFDKLVWQPFFPYSLFWQHKSPKSWDRYIWANNIDPEQIALE